MPVSADGRGEYKKVIYGRIFDVQLDSLEKSVSANAEKLVDFLAKFLGT